MFLYQISLSSILSFTGTYAKSFGQVYISDDAFLVAAATVQNIMNGTARLMVKRKNMAKYKIPVIAE